MCTKTLIQGYAAAAALPLFQRFCVAVDCYRALVYFAGGNCKLEMPEHDACMLTGNNSSFGRQTKVKSICRRWICNRGECMSTSTWSILPKLKEVVTIALRLENDKCGFLFIKILADSNICHCTKVRYILRCSDILEHQSEVPKERPCAGLEAPYVMEGGPQL